MIAWGWSLVFCLVALVPVFRRLSRPTLLTDDVTRLVDLARFPFSHHLFLPFSNHRAPFFQLVSWIAWQMIGHDVRRAPLALCAASVLPWILVLLLFGRWLARESGSPLAALVSVALVAQSPLVLEAVYWYSASSFNWAIAAILVGLIGAGKIARRPVGSLILIGIGSSLGPAATTLGVLAAPLAVLRVVSERRASRRVKVLAILAAGGGLFAYIAFTNLGSVEPLLSSGWWGKTTIEPVAGLGYVLTVPGRIVWPATLGVRASLLASPLPPWAAWGAGLLALGAFAFFLLSPKAAWDRRLVLLGGTMIYLGYALVYPARAAMLSINRWSEAQLLYQYGGRYHVLPLLGAAAIIAALLAAWPLVRRCDSSRCLPAIIGTLIGLGSLAIQHGEAAAWDWMLYQPDQKTTLKALHRLGGLARREGIPRSQLARLFDPCYRTWNCSLLLDCPYAFPLTALAVDAPDSVKHPLPDEEARRRLLAHLGQYERTILGAGTCASLNPAKPSRDASTLAVARCVGLHRTQEVTRGQYKGEARASYIEFEFDRAEKARVLYLPGLKADQDVVLLRQDDDGRWRAGQSVRWLQSPAAEAAAAIDLERTIHWSNKPISRIRVKFTRPGEIAVSQPPRLLR